MGIITHYIHWHDHLFTYETTTVSQDTTWCVICCKARSHVDCARRCCRDTDMSWRNAAMTAVPYYDFQIATVRSPKQGQRTRETHLPGAC